MVDATSTRPMCQPIPGTGGVGSGPGMGVGIGSGVGQGVGGGMGGFGPPGTTMTMVLSRAALTEQADQDARYRSCSS